jgi:hypothetical protein
MIVISVIVETGVADEKNSVVSGSDGKFLRSMASKKDCNQSKQGLFPCLKFQLRAESRNHI